MDKHQKLQIFVSSTYLDLVEEREAAVRTILDCGHIPAGMELFKSGKKTWDIIKRWIDESDVYVLILGGRYGSLESESGLSYTELEYRYALEQDKPLFAIVINEKELKRREIDRGDRVTEKINQDKYKLFRNLVESRHREEFDDVRGIERAIYRMIPHLEKEFNFNQCGWYSAKKIMELEAEIKRLRDVNSGYRDITVGQMDIPAENGEKYNKLLSNIKWASFEEINAKLPANTDFKFEFDNGKPFAQLVMGPLSLNDLWFGAWYNIFWIGENQHNGYYRLVFRIKRGILVEKGITLGNLGYLQNEMESFCTKFDFKYYRTAVDSSVSRVYSEDASIDEISTDLAKLVNFFSPILDSLNPEDQLPF